VTVSPASIYVAIFVGTPQWFIITLALYLFTGTKVEAKKYIALSLMSSALTFLVRLLPISLGVNTILVMITEILLFQVFNRNELSKIFKLIISAVVIMIFIGLAELLNMLLLVSIFGEPRAIELFTSSGGLIQTLSSMPSNVFLGLLVLIGYLVLRAMKKRKGNPESGETGA
jgi:hypothetical protein